jgi:hypothetical protein
MVRAPSPFDPHAVSSLRRVVACLLTGHRPAPLDTRNLTNYLNLLSKRLRLFRYIRRSESFVVLMSGDLSGTLSPTSGADMSVLLSPALVFLNAPTVFQ